jgi:hypothetical protein
VTDVLQKEGLLAQPIKKAISRSPLKDLANATIDWQDLTPRDGMGLFPDTFFTNL